MLESSLHFWVLVGVGLVVGELLLPGLVSIFIGLGALTVALLLYLGLIQGMGTELLVWFMSSTVYIFTLRLLVMRWLPSDRGVTSIDEDENIMGKVAIVTETLGIDQEGRISVGGTTWKARSRSPFPLIVGSPVKIVERDNISYIVEPVSPPDEKR